MNEQAWRDKRREIRDERRETRDERQEARDKGLQKGVKVLVTAVHYPWRQRRNSECFAGSGER